MACYLAYALNQLELRAHLLDGCDYARLLMFDAVAIRPWGSPFVQHVRQHEAAFAGVPEYLQRAILAAYIRGAIARPIMTTFCQSSADR